MQEKDIMVSVYCLTFNHEKYISSALDGFVNQKTKFKYQVLVHDDASTDKTPEIIEEYAKKYPNLIVPILQVENQYSKGINIKKEFIIPNLLGKYVACCEGDDYWCDNNKLQKQFDFLEDHTEYIACGHNTWVENMWKKNKRRKLMYEERERDIDLKDAIYTVSLHTSSIMYRSNVHDKQPAFVTMSNVMGDYPFQIYLCTQGKIKFMNEVMSVYRWGTIGSWTRERYKNMDNTTIQFFVRNEILNEVNKYTKYKYEELINDAILKNEFTIALAQREYDSLKIEPLKTIYKNQDIKSKFIIFLKRHFTLLYKMYRFCKLKIYRE